MAKKPKNRSGLTRQQPTRKPRSHVLIVCEGEKTEPTYFKCFIKHYRLNSAEVVVTRARGSDPDSIFKHAKKIQQKEKGQAEQYDKVFCVFDRDQHSKFEQVSNEIKKAKGLEHTRSWPCFEFWLLLHFSYRRSPFEAVPGRSAPQACQSELKKHLPNYHKALTEDWETLHGKLEAAISNAKKAEKDAETTGEPNPSTEVHKLIEYLQQLKT